VRRRRRFTMTIRRIYNLYLENEGVATNDGRRGTFIGTPFLD
jgi:hypothetical protein